MRLILKQSKLKGYSLIELVIAVALISLLSLSLINSIFGINILTKTVEKTNELIVKENYGVDYIVNEIDKCEYIITKPIVGIKKDKWMGFSVCKINPNSKEEKYEIITFILENKSIRRCILKTDSLDKRLRISYFNKNNVVLYEVDEFNGEIIQEKSIANLNIKIKDSKNIFIKHILNGKVYEE